VLKLKSGYGHNITAYSNLDFFEFSLNVFLKNYSFFTGNLQKFV
jgi:hypothetical protein